MSTQQHQTLADNTPIIIGVGQYVERIHPLSQPPFSAPMQLAATACQAALHDAGVTATVFTSICNTCHGADIHAVKAGTGTFPGTIDPELREKDAFKTYWMNTPITFPFLDNKLSWDLMPGVSMTKNYGTEETTAWAFTYSTRLAYNPWGPKFSFVGELYKIGDFP